MEPGGAKLESAGADMFTRGTAAVADDLPRLLVAARRNHPKAAE